MEVFFMQRHGFGIQGGAPRGLKRGGGRQNEGLNGPAPPLVVPPVPATRYGGGFQNMGPQPPRVIPLVQVPKCGGGIQNIGLRNAQVIPIVQPVSVPPPPSPQIQVLPKSMVRPVPVPSIYKLAPSIAGSPQPYGEIECNLSGSDALIAGGVTLFVAAALCAVLFGVWAVLPAVLGIALIVAGSIMKAKEKNGPGSGAEDRLPSREEVERGARKREAYN